MQSGEREKEDKHQLFDKLLTGGVFSPFYTFASLSGTNGSVNSSIGNLNSKNKVRHVADKITDHVGGAATDSNFSCDVCGPETLILDSMVANNTDTCIIDLNLEVKYEEKGVNKDEKELFVYPSHLAVYAHRLFDEMPKEGVVCRFDERAPVSGHLLESAKHRFENTHFAVEEVKEDIKERNYPLAYDAPIHVVNNQDISCIHVPVYSNALPDVLMETLIFDSNEGGNDFVTAGELFGIELGLDSNLDPEHALALQVSMEEAQTRLDESAKEAAEQENREEHSTYEGKRLTANVKATNEIVGNDS